MRIDRLLGIVIYLLNRDIVNGNALAERFEVSSRTIQRDIEALCLAGIPIVSLQGTNGGYGIIDGFKLDKQITTPEDYQFIKTALEGLCSAYDNKKLEDILEKIRSSSQIEKEQDATIKFDFSVSREGNNIDEYMKTIENAIEEKSCIKYDYTNSYGDKMLRTAEPIGVVYKWYAWYMLAFCSDKKDYRLFKVARMRNLDKSGEAYSKKHDNFEMLLREQEQQDTYNYMDVKIEGKKDVRLSAEEYFPNGKITALENEDFIMEFRAPENEIGWKGLLLTFGNKIKIIAPERLKTEFIAKAKEIIDIYN